MSRSNTRVLREDKQQRTAPENRIFIEPREIDYRDAVLAFPAAIHEYCEDKQQRTAPENRIYYG